MERDRSYRGRISQRIAPVDIMPKEVYLKKNKDKSWLYKEYPEFHINFICISKDGTLGEIYKVGNLIIGLPSVEGKEIINEDLSPDDAKWVRHEPPIEFEKLWYKFKEEISTPSVNKRVSVRKRFVQERNILIKKHQEFIDSEFEKREHGIFIKIDLDVFYLTGEHWMFLKHYYLTESDMYGFFRVPAMESYWHWEACVADSRGWGEFRGKGRRTSWSVESASIALNVFTITRYANIPIVSERKDLAGELFTGKIVQSFEYYPIYFKPLIPLPHKEIASNLNITFETNKKEISKINFYPTKITAYDSTKVKTISINDELGKWMEISLSEYITRHYRCHTEGNTAKARCGSTAGEYKSGGGEEFQTEFLNADPDKRNQLGRTGNGLISLFIDICYTTTQPISYFDEWGYAVVFDPKEPILSEVGEWLERGAITDWDITYESLKKNKGGDSTIQEEKKVKTLNAFLRDMPREIEHMFRNEGGVNNDFDIDNLNNHADFLYKLSEEELTGIIYRGNLIWTGEEFDSPVEWRENPRGKFFTTWLPDKKQRNKYTMKMFMGKSIKFPSNNELGCFGVDPYDIIGNTTDNQGSDEAIVGYSKMSMAGCPSHSFFLKYKERPDKRNDSYDDVIKACQYFGFYANIESNKARLLEYIWEKGFTGYVMRRQDKRWKFLSDAEKLWGGIPSSTAVNEDHASGLKDYILDFVGNTLETDCKVYFLDLIQEWIDFNILKRKKFDLAVASGFAKMGAQYRVKQRRTAEEFMQQKGLGMASFGA